MNRFIALIHFALHFLCPTPMGATVSQNVSELRANCRALLHQSDTLPQILKKLDQARSSVDWMDGEKSQLVLLETLLTNETVLSALRDGDSAIRGQIRGLLNTGSSQYFYRQAYSLLHKLRPPGLNNFLHIVEQNILSNEILPADLLPKAAFAPNPKVSPFLSARLGLLFDHKPEIPPASFSRRLFAYMGRNPGLSQEQKFHLALNFIDEFNRQRETHNQHTSPTRGKLSRYSAYPLAEPTSDGTRIICGTMLCPYFFAIKRNGKFYHGHRQPGLRHFDPENWEQAELIREAGSAWQ